MNYKKIAQNLYTTRRRLYNLFITLVGYKAAVKKFFSQSHYLKSNMRILDAGCGMGLVTKILHTIAKQKKLKDIQFNGFDLTPAMLASFQQWIDKKQISNITLQQADVLNTQELPINWKNYDLITVSGMLEHLPRKRITEAINNLKKLLAPKGKLVIIICERNSLSYWVIYKWWKAQIYTKKEMTQIINNAGFTTFSFKEFSFPYSYLNSWVHIIEATNSNKIFRIF